MNFPTAILLAALSLVTGAESLHAVPYRLSPARHAVDALPDPLGRAGMASATLMNREGSEILLAAGGANFPYAKPGAVTPEERGAKVFYSDIFLLENGHWSLVGQLPQPLAYAAFFGTSHGLVIAGGCNAEGHVKECFLVNPGDKTVLQQLPPLPHPIAYPAFAVSSGKLYVVGGQLAPDSTEALNSAYILNLDTPGKTWKKLPDMPGPGRILATGAAVDGKILVMGGCSLAPDSKGKAERTYLKSVRMFDTATQQWSRDNPPDIPETIAASANPAPVINETVLLIGGDTGEYYRATLQHKAQVPHPGQSHSVFAFDTRRQTWTPAGNWPVGIATAPAVLYQGGILSISGETHPGIRTPSTGAASFSL